MTIKNPNPSNQEQGWDDRRLPNDIRQKWHRMLTFYKAVFPEFYERMLDFSEENIIVLIRTLELKPQSEIKNLLIKDRTSCSRELHKIKDKITGVNPERHDTPPAAKKRHYAAPIMRDFALYVALRDFPDQDKRLFVDANNRQLPKDSPVEVRFVARFRRLDRCVRTLLSLLSRLAVPGFTLIIHRVTKSKPGDDRNHPGV